MRKRERDKERERRREKEREKEREREKRLGSTKVDERLTTSLKWKADCEFISALPLSSLHTCHENDQCAAGFCRCAPGCCDRHPGGMDAPQGTWVGPEAPAGDT